MSKSNVQWTPHRDPYERAREAFKVSYLSDAKWRKVFGAVADAELNLEKSLWKFIDSEYLYDWPMPRRQDLLATRLADSGGFQPVEYKWIEWIRFPRSWQPRPGVGFRVSQNLDRLLLVLEQTAQLHVQTDADGLTLLAYGR